MRIEISVAEPPLVGVIRIDGGAPRTFPIIFDVLEIAEGEREAVEALVRREMGSACA